MIDESKLVKVSTYAKKISKCPVWVYKLIKKGKVQGIKIDGVTFVVVD